MSFFEFPHTRTYDTDLGWIIKKLIEMDDELKNFINFNTIKYADPILWSITTQYESNTVVIDPETGSAYISTRPVPYGVAISNTDYWTPIFNYGEEMDALEQLINDGLENLREQIAASNEGTSPTATRGYLKGELLWWNDLLYRALYDFPAGTAFIENTNVEKITVEELLNTALAEFKTEINNSFDDFKTEINTTINDFEGEVGTDLANMQDELDSFSENLYYVTPEEFGAKGDGVTDDTAAIQSAINAAISDHKTVEFRAGGKYIISSPLEIVFVSNTTYTVLHGNGAILYAGGGVSAIKIHTQNVFDEHLTNWYTYVYIHDLTINALSTYQGSGVVIGTPERPGIDGKIVFENVNINDFTIGVEYNIARNVYFSKCGISAQIPLWFSFYQRYPGDSGYLFNGDSEFSFCTFYVRNSGTLVQKANPQAVSNSCNISGLHFSHCYFYGQPNQTQGYISINAGGVETRARCFDWFFDNCQWDGIEAVLFNLTSFGDDPLGIINDFVISNCYGYTIAGVLNAHGVRDITINNSYFHLTTTSPVTNPVALDAATTSQGTRKTKNAIFSNNIIEGISTSPITIGFSENVVFDGNAIANGAWTAFFLSDVDRVTITGNVIEDDPSVVNPSMYFMQQNVNGYNISGNANSSTAIAQ